MTSTPKKKSALAFQRSKKAKRLSFLSSLVVVGVLLLLLLLLVVDGVEGGVVDLGVADAVAGVALEPLADLDVAAGGGRAVGVELAHGLDELGLARGVLAALRARRHRRLPEHDRLAAVLGDPARVRPRVDPVDELGVGAQVVVPRDGAHAADGLARGELRVAGAGLPAAGEVRGDALLGGRGQAHLQVVADGGVEVEGAVDDGDGESWGLRRKPVELAWCASSLKKNGEGRGGELGSMLFTYRHCRGRRRT